MDVLKNIFVKNYIPSTWLIRKVMEEENSWYHKNVIFKDRCRH